MRGLWDLWVRSSGEGSKLNRVLGSINLLVIIEAVVWIKSHPKRQDIVRKVGQGSWKPSLKAWAEGVSAKKKGPERRLC